MSFTNLEKTFQNYMVNEPCWNIPSRIRREAIEIFDTITAADLTRTEREACARDLLEQLCDSDIDTAHEAEQVASLKKLLNEGWISEEAKKAILQDMAQLETMTA